MQPDQTQATSLISALGMDNLSQEEKDDLVSKMAETLQNRIFMSLMRQITDEQKVELEKLSTEDNSKVMEYLQNNVPNLEEISTIEYEKLKNELLATNDEVNAMLRSKEQAENTPAQQG